MLSSQYCCNVNRAHVKAKFTMSKQSSVFVLIVDCGDNRPLDEAQRRTVNVNRVHLLDLLDSNHVFLTELATAGCITWPQREHLLNVIQPRDINDQLMEFLLRRSVDDFNKFIRVLSKTQAHLVRFLVTGQGESFQQTVCFVCTRKISCGRKSHTASVENFANLILTCEILVPTCDSTTLVHMCMTINRLSAKTEMPIFPLLVEFSLVVFPPSHAGFVNSRFAVSSNISCHQMTCFKVKISSQPLCLSLSFPIL